ncbi:MAG: P-II family nitrogen regulator [Spirochaetia bacterium]|nr:P-II family nitrogen regulator [Spirochaetia bacterium]
MKPHRLEAIKEEPNKREIFRLTVLDASGYGRQRGQLQYFRRQEIGRLLYSYFLIISLIFINYNA